MTNLFDSTVEQLLKLSHVGENDSSCFSLFLNVITSSLNAVMPET